MTGAPVSYRRDHAADHEVLAHLRECSDAFSPPLADRVDVGEYAVKLVARARRFEAWDGDTLIGLVAVYLPEAPGGDAFVTSVSVRPADTGCGIGGRLLGECLIVSRGRGDAGVALEVSTSAARTVEWYARRGFRVISEGAGTLCMRLEHAAQAADAGAPQLHPYAGERYASAFAGLEPLYLPGVRSHVLARPVPGREERDAMGCYPLFVFDPQPSIEQDFDLLRERGLVSLVGVTDCLTPPGEDFLHRHFDVVRPFKTHHVHDARAPNGSYTKHHRDRVRRARRDCETRVIDLARHLDSWCACYDTLVAKRCIRGITAFPRSYFETVARMPEAVTIAAFHGEEMTAAHIWMRFEGRVYAHLAASTPLGYRLRSAFAVYDHAIQLFRDDHVIDFGGGAGAGTGGSDGLSEFKRGFANVERVNRLCGKILDRYAYEALAVGLETDFFPAYRAPGAPRAGARQIE